mgnify:FL=1|tara:strand:- start:1149 stop:1343 length:195 start_codon:yes stop_codon:yes gene_type:complete
MIKTKFYWNEETINYYVTMYETNDFASISKSILQFVITDCDTPWETVQEKFNDLITEVESKIQY